MFNKRLLPAILSIDSSRALFIQRLIKGFLRPSSPVETFVQIAPNLAATLLMLLGGAALCFPKTMAAFVGIQPIAPIGISEIRSTLGSFLLGLSATCLWLQSAEAFTVMGVASIGAAIVRLLSSVVDRSVTIKNIGGVVAEGLLGVLFLLS